MSFVHEGPRNAPDHEHLEPIARTDMAAPAASGPFALGERSGAWYSIVDAAGNEVEKVQGMVAAEARVAELNG